MTESANSTPTYNCGHGDSPRTIGCASSADALPVGVTVRRCIPALPAPSLIGLEEPLTAPIEDVAAARRACMENPNPNPRPILHGVVPLDKGKKVVNEGKITFGKVKINMQGPPQLLDRFADECCRFTRRTLQYISPET
ncbi:hypothetical protein Salat_1136600 [Sesamum alatum]|uniref:Uncharacterized protein n=1 Tax=Sesamum alatum TaxID=300844 RepID=A0AAE1YE18_9LAMI|nr:hypothetical protein Salat_1136600 [Sesamum alatum]